MFKIFGEYFDTNTGTLSDEAKVFFSQKSINSDTLLSDSVTDFSSNPSRIDTYPHQLFHKEGASTFGFLYVDGELGNDANDGTRLDTAKKTIQAAINILPQDLRGAQVWIMVHPGIYTSPTYGTPVIEIGSRYNGVIVFTWLGLWYNEGDPAIHTWKRGGTVRSNDQIVIQGNVPSSGNGVFFTSWSSCPNLEIKFRGWAAVKGGWDSNQSAYAYRWKFQNIAVDGAPLLTIANIKHFDIEYPIELDLTDLGNVPAVSLNTINSARLGGFLAKSNTPGGSKCQKYVDIWGGLVYIHNCQLGVNFNSTYFPANAWASGYGLEVSEKYHIIEGVRTLMSVWGGSATYDNNSTLLYRSGSLGDATLPSIRLSTITGYCSINYHSDQCTVVDSSVGSRFIKDYKTFTAFNYYVSSYFKSVGSNAMIATHTASPPSDSLAARDLCFYLDESNNKLMVKVKYSNGTTIASGSIALS